MNIAGRILVADGAPTTRIIAKVRLTTACYEVITATSGAEALRLAERSEPQIVLIGPALPDMTSAQLCTALRELVGMADLPILVQAQGAARIDALRAGASALIDDLEDDLTLLARIRGLMRSDPLAQASGPPDILAEPAAKFRHSERPHAVFIAGQPGTALGWRHALQRGLDFAITVCEPDRALADAAYGQVPDIYLIAADMNQPGDGLRLLSELRSRPVSKEAGFVIILAPERLDMTAVALDLGAGDVLASGFANPLAVSEAAMRLEAQLRRKREQDRLRRETLRQMQWAMSDPLTGLYNRRHALPRLAAMLEDAMRAQRHLSVIVMDLDRFKQVNDGFGHAAGDAVLRSVAQQLSRALPAEAVLARIGGEEFLAVLPDHPLHAACEIAETLRQQVAASPVPLPLGCPAAEIRISFSAGIASLQGSQGPQDPFLTPDLLLSQADRALFSAKAQGRNRIVLAGAPVAA
ncbi:diguanylate cyclase [Paracoccus ravus]|uniref:diguanylate cyclase n=1 Tax=Paracoccus ravus TaxID=2447760 RepID=UPI00106E27EF|nr:diguanylate cyclase [Paracoccus ravus]